MPIYDTSSNVKNSEKNVVGISGTPFPNRKKNDILITYTLHGGHVLYISDLASNIQMKVEARYEGMDVRYKKKGISSKGDFKEQAIIVRVRGEALPIQRRHINKIEGIIERAADELRVDKVVIDQS